MRSLYIDIETYSATALDSAGVYRYVEDSEFEVLMAAYAVDDGPVELITGHEAIAERLLPLIQDPQYRVVAHNAAFERISFSRLAGLPSGQYLPAERWHDTMAVAAARGYPQSLDRLAAALGGEQKDTAGTALINLFCKPHASRGRTLPEQAPLKWDQFCAYCVQDVVTLRDVDRRLGELPGIEAEVWQVDQIINDRGVAVDRAMAEAGHRSAEVNQTTARARITELTGVENARSNTQMLAWARSQGLALPNLQSKTIDAAVASMDPGTVAHEVLTLRQELSLAAASKYAAAQAMECADGRIRGAIRYFGAHTGRWAGRGFQLHNLPRDAFEHEVDELLAVDDLHRGEVLPAAELKKLVRALLVGPFVVADYAAIEARVIAWLAGEDWALDAFRQGRDIYVETAARMTRPGEEPVSRQVGKVAVLALGYGGGIRSLEAMGAEGDEAWMTRVRDDWRAANPHIVSLWSAIDAAMRYVAPGRARRVRVTAPGRGKVDTPLVVHSSADGTSRGIQLPSGRLLQYHGISWKRRVRSAAGDTYEPSTPTDRWSQMQFRDPRTGVPVDTYGGRLAENVTQAVARDLLAGALVRLEARGLRPVAHVHDEVVCETDDLDAVVEAMTAPEPWAPGLPVAAEAFHCQRYRKG